MSSSPVAMLSTPSDGVGASDGDQLGHRPVLPARHRWVLELLLAIGVACVVSVALQWVVTRLNIPMPSFAPQALLALSSVVLLGVALWLISTRAWPRWASPVSWAGLSALGTLPLALMLQNTPFYLFGVSGDQFFRTQYLQRLTESVALADGNYVDVPPFYPAGWFWIGGRFANLVDMPAWAAYKPYAILTMAVAPVIAFALWSRVTRRPTALLLSVLTCVVGLRVSAYEPYSWLLVASMVPIAVIAWREFRAVVAGHGRSWQAIALVGIFLGACGAIYTLHFGFFAMLLVVLALGATAARVWRSRTVGGRIPIREALATARTVVGELSAVGVFALPLVLLVWTPFLLRVVQTGELPSGAAPRFLPRIGAVLPTPMFEFSVSGVLCLAGTVWIVLAWRRSEKARVLGILTVCCYGWYVLSFIALSTHTTLLAFRMEPVLHTVLFCAGGLGLLELARKASSWHSMPRSVPTGAVFGVVAVLGLVSLVQTVRPPESEGGGVALFDHAYRTYGPAGVTALGKADPQDTGAWNDELLATLDELSIGKPEDHVMLTTYFDLLAYRPYWGFQTTVEHYANPFVNFGQRRALIDSWAASSSADELVQKLNNSPYAAPDVFVFRRAADGLHIQVSRDAFPKSPNNRFHDVVFPRKLFDERHFKTRDVGPFTIAVRRGTVDHLS